MADGEDVTVVEPPGTGAEGVPLRIGIFGGTFDPIHVGHLAIADAARHELDLDQVLLVVAHTPWQKVGSRQITPSAVRLAMVSAAVEAVDGLDASAIEIERGGNSYTVDTIEAIGAANPGAELFVLVGTDVAGDLDTWHRADHLRQIATMAVVQRPGSIGVGVPAGWNAIDVPAPRLNISSSELRDRLGRGKPVNFLVPEAALVIYRGWQMSNDQDLA